MAFTQVTVTGTYKLADGSAAEGVVRFTPGEPMRNDTVVAAAPVSETLDGSGALSVSLAATDDAATESESGEPFYLVEELLVGQPARAYYIPIPHNLGAVDLADVAPAAGGPINSQSLYAVRLDALDGISNVGTVGASQALTAGGGGGTVKLITLGANCTFTFTTPSADGRVKTLELLLTQDATGGRTVTWPASVKWAGGTPTLSTAAGAVDRLVFVTYNGGTTWYGDLVGKGYA